MWLVHYNKFDALPVKPNQEQLNLLDSDLRGFIVDSLSDHFSSAFFRTNYDKLPEIEKMINDIRKRIEDIDRDLNAIPRGEQICLNYRGKQQ